LERVLGRRELLDRDAGLHLLSVHHAFIVVYPSIALHFAARDRRHRHTRAVGARVGVDLLGGAVTEDPDALARPHLPGAVRVAHDRESTGEPGAFVRAGDLAAGPHRSRFHFAFGRPGADKVAQTLVLGTGLGRTLRLGGGRDLNPDE